MSPEQAKGTGLTPAQIYGVWVRVIYEMVTGHLPFEAEQPTEVIGLILNKEPLPFWRDTIVTRRPSSNESSQRP